MTLYLQRASTAGLSWPLPEARDRWLEARRAKLLPIPYFHVVFTLPHALARDAWKAFAVRLRFLTNRFGSDPKWAEYLDVYRKGLAIISKSVGVSAEEQANTDLVTEQWPTPGVMLRRTPPFVSGNRLAVLKELYEYHYPAQSAQAHGRLATLGIAMLVDAPEEQWNPGYGESEIVVSALLFVACILSEIESAGKYQHHPKLAELWTYLRDLDDESKELWALRYEQLAGGGKWRDGV